MEVTDSEAIRGGVPALAGQVVREPASRRGAAATPAGEPAEGAATNAKLDVRAAAQVAGALNDFANAMNVRIAFLVDQATGKTVIKVIDQETKEVIRQVPPEEMLRLVARMNQLLGVLLNHQA